jgi:hypothetical protein
VHVSTHPADPDALLDCEFLEFLRVDTKELVSFGSLQRRRVFTTDLDEPVSLLLVSSGTRVIGEIVLEFSLAAHSKSSQSARETKET